MKLPVAILAGGLATRLHPITRTLPKALVDIAGQPFIVRQLRYLRGQGVPHVVLCVGYLGEQISAAIGDGAALGLSVAYSPDGPRLLGTGGALKRALPLLGEQFLVLYGDSFLPIDMAAVERDFLVCGKPALMTVLANEGRWDKSNVLFDAGQIAEYNKRQPLSQMRHIDYGFSALSAGIFSDYPADEPFDLSDIFHDLSIRGLLAGHEVHERFYEIGSPEGLRETTDYFQRGET